MKTHNSPKHIIHDNSRNHNQSRWEGGNIHHRVHRQGRQYPYYNRPFKHNQSHYGQYGHGQRKPQPICFLDKDYRFNSFMGSEQTNTHRKQNLFKRVGAGGIIIDPQGRLLIVKGTAKWSLPKGHLDPGEKYHECAMREIQEEANVKIHLEITDRYIDVKKCVYFIIVLSDTEDLKLKTNDPAEISEVKWATLEEIADLDCNRQLDYVVSRWAYIQSIIDNSGERLVRYPLRDIGFSSDSNNDGVSDDSEKLYFVPNMKLLKTCETSSAESCESRESDSTVSHVDIGDHFFQRIQTEDGKVTVSMA